MPGLLCAIHPSAGEGGAVFAMKDDSAGTPILDDRRVMGPRRRLPGLQLTPQQVQTALSDLLKGDQKESSQLHEGKRAMQTRLLRIYKANALGSREEESVVFWKKSLRYIKSEPSFCAEH
ncbi:hypothetical protein LTR37_012763 [Vermiconidia calcicola]|uniref:Uncharacterized protein n=1 Tax=Vermiconidia calcicola TaxID=1690605 RepID=A0ACC3MYB7_9PEZI|nr:hypothetical protein LTR37_012763 [Vermiconidia calcicola]